MFTASSAADSHRGTKSWYPRGVVSSLLQLRRMSTSEPSQDAAMRYSQGDLAILSAEVYAPGLPFPSATRSLASKKTLNSSSRSSDEGPRKRAKIQSADLVEREDEDKKRSRGRPRLDVKDETAADRRRTQIRLAQRAYRNRKENAIQTLEKKVQDLKDANEGMSNVFLQLHDFAINSGTLEGNPEFGRQLRLTTERFLALARKASEDVGRDDEAGNASPEDWAGPAKSSSPEHVDNTAVDTVSAKPKTQPLLYGGFTITHEPVTDADLITDFSSGGLPPPTTSALNFEIITQPTLENASFPFGSVPEFNYGDFTQPSPYSSLPLPTTYTSQEATFGRRLHRFASERALFLISMPNPPPERLNRVFGFCFLMESRDAIYRRLQRTVGRSIQEDLSNWQYPFFNLGGAGTHFDATNTGNHGAADILKPQNSTGFSTGPFTPDVANVQDNAIDKAMRMGVPGFSGDFFDCEEVEVYLHERGVTIPPGADHVTVEVDPTGFGKSNMSPNMFGSTTSSGFSSLTATSFAGTESFNNSNSLFPPSTSNGSNSSALSPASSAEGAPSLMTTTSSQPPSNTGWVLSPTPGSSSGLVDPILSGVFSQVTGTSYLPTTSTASAGPNFGLSSDSSGSGNGLFGFMASSSTTPNRQTVTVDVHMLITKITERATCLGRTPGFRELDVNDAFWKAAKVIRG